MMNTVTRASASNYSKASTKFYDFFLSDKYVPIKVLGSGAYGVVCSARLTQPVEGIKEVAIKKISHAFQNAEDAKRLLREIKLLKHLRHENIMRLYDIMYPSSWKAFDDVYMVSELLDTDLHQIIKSDQPLSEDHVQFFIYQILRALKYIHSANVLHRDLKPSNILINENCELKLCDFGLSRHINKPCDVQYQQLTLYVTTRWYRAPEILLSDTYSKPIDIWSAGCILAELLGRRPLFTGKSYWQQIHVIIGVLGTPDDNEISYITNIRARKFLRQAPMAPKIDLSRLYPRASKLAIDLLARMLQFDPRRRITVEDALRHPYLESLHEPDDEPACNETFNFAFEQEVLTGERVKELLFREMMDFHPEHANELEKMYQEARTETLAAEQAEMDVEESGSGVDSVVNVLLSECEQVHPILSSPTLDE